MEDLDKGTFLPLLLVVFSLSMPTLLYSLITFLVVGVLLNFVGASGLDAIGRVLRKAKKEGMRTFGHSYKKSESDIAGLSDHV